MTIHSCVMPKKNPQNWEALLQDASTNVKKCTFLIKMEICVCPYVWVERGGSTLIEAETTSSSAFKLPRFPSKKPPYRNDEKPANFIYLCIKRSALYVLEITKGSHTLLLMQTELAGSGQGSASERLSKYIMVTENSCGRARNKTEVSWVPAQCCKH